MLQIPVNFTNQRTTISWFISWLHLDYILTIPWHMFASTYGSRVTLWGHGYALWDGSYCAQLCLNLSIMELQAQNELIIYIYIYEYIWLRSRSDFERLCLNINFIDLQGHDGLPYVYIHIHMAHGLLFMNMVTRSTSAGQITLWQFIFKHKFHWNAKLHWVALMYINICIWHMAYLDFDQLYEKILIIWDWTFAT